MSRAAHEDVLEHGHVSEQFYRLERAHDALPSGIVQRTDHRRTPVDYNLSRVEWIEPGRKIDQRRLAGTVRSNQPMNCVGCAPTIHIAKGLYSAKSLGDIVQLQPHTDGGWKFARRLGADHGGGHFAARCTRFPAGEETHHAVRQKIKS